MSNMKQKTVKPKAKTTRAVAGPKKPAAATALRAPRTKSEKKDEKDVPVSNGFGENRKRTKTVSKANVGKKVKPTEDVEIAPGSSASEEVVKSNRKRKQVKGAEVVEIDKGATDSAEVPEKKIRTAVKRQKVLLEIPKLPSISGHLFVLGTNEDGQLGMDPSVSLEKKRPFELNFPCEFVDIAAGSLHSACLNDKGEVYTFGCNHEGALGRITEVEGSECIPGKVDIPDVVVKLSAGDSHSAALTESGKVYIWGNFRNEAGEGHIGLIVPDKKETSPVQILSNVTIVSISSGSNHVICLSNEGTVYTCGSGDHGQLGRISERSCQGTGRKGLVSLLEPNVVSVRPQKCLMDSVWAGAYCNFLRAKDSGVIYGFGLNNYCQLGFQDAVGLKSFRPKRINTFAPESQWKQICCGEHHTLALDNKGQVYCVGRQDYGRLGLGDESAEKPTVIPTLEGKECVNISCGERCSFSVTKDGLLFSWGMGTLYQLGHGNDDDCETPKLIERTLAASWSVFKVSGGGQHTLILANRKATTEDMSDSKEQVKQKPTMEEKSDSKEQ